MVKQTIEGNIAVAEVVARCGARVVPAYPISPSTHIPERLSQLQVAYGFDFIPVEGEHSALSAAIGASAAGARTFTATSSQGLLYMPVVLHTASGLRLPIVMAVANRAVSAPLNIWNDWMDSFTQRDTGWMQFYAKNNQEIVDLVIQSFKIAEATEFPVMACFDGFVLTHEISPVDIPTREEIAEFLPPFKPKHSLDVAAPESFGTYAAPEHYQEIKLQQHEEMLATLPAIERVAADFEKKFGRTQYAFFEDYRGYAAAGAKTVFFTLGSLAETTEVAVDALRARGGGGSGGESVGLVRLRCFRPFPTEALVNAFAKAERVLVIEKDVSLGYEGVLASELKAAFYDSAVSTAKPKIIGVVNGLGGREVTVRDVISLYEKNKK
ncbi:MAG: pyruvate ferredoxin oxidoreductase [Candidatus Micrarchaeota archaeon]